MSVNQTCSQTLSESSLNLPNNKQIEFKHDVENLNKHKPNMNSFKTK